MAKQLARSPLSASDLNDLLASESDFPFEMAVLAALDSLGFVCDHSHTYIDPVTQKIRQFDIRARLSFGPEHHLHLSIERKNLQTFFPLIVHRVPRRDDEAFHNLIRYWPMPHSPVPPITDRSVLRHSDKYSRYRGGDLVGKRFDQVGKAGSDGSAVIDDSDVFGKLSQALSSANDLVQAAANHNERGLHCVIPIIVVPDGTLWAMDYDSHGAVTASPHQVEDASYFIRHPWPLDGPGGLVFTVSHLEVHTFTSLRSHVRALIDPPSLGLFPVSWKPEWM